MNDRCWALRQRPLTRVFLDFHCTSLNGWRSTGRRGSATLSPASTISDTRKIWLPSCFRWISFLTLCRWSAPHFRPCFLYSCNPTVGWRARRPWGTSFSKIYLLSFLIYPTVSEIECRKVTRRSSWIRKTLNERVQVQSSELTLRLVCCESSFDTSWRERFKEADFRSAWPDSRLQYPISR